MAYNDLHVGIRASKTQSLGAGSSFASNIVAALRTWQRGRMRRKILAGLTPDQLRDIGHSENNRPVLEIDAGLMTNMMSMR